MNLAEIIRTDHGVYLFDAYLNVILPLEPAMVSDLINCPDKCNLNELPRNPFLPAEFVISEPPLKSEYEWLLNNRQEHLVLCVTNQCNLRCTYCGYQDDRYCNKEFKYSNMPEDIAHCAIDRYLRSSTYSKYKAIGFYGGEPLLNFKLIKNCVNYVKTLSGISNVIYSLTTNGLLLENKEIADFLVENHFLVTISLDGPESVHDRYRVDTLSNPTFGKVIYNLTQIFQRYPYAKNHFSYNAVLAPPIDTDLVYDFFDNNQIEEIMTSGCTVSNYFENYLYKNDLNYKFKSNHDISEFERIYEYYLADFIPFYHMRERRPDAPIRGGGFCIPFVRKLYVSTVGNYFVCERVNEYVDWGDVGNVFEGFNIDNCYSLIEKITLMAKEKCKDCICANYCKICYANYKSDNLENLCKTQRKAFLMKLNQYLTKRDAPDGHLFEKKISEIAII